MKKEEIQLGDWARIFFGEVPGSFYIEVIIRTAFIFLLIIVTMRLLGRRMAAQLSRNELIALVSLAAATGVPLQAPDRGLLPAVLICAIIAVIARLMAKWSYKSQKFERISQDNINVLVADAVMQLGVMKQSRITRDRLFAQLRSEGIRHLGQVQRLYIEANGSFTMIRQPQPRPGLSILPPWDEDFVAEQQRAEAMVCDQCGTEQQKEQQCTCCHSTEWTKAMV